MRRTAATCGAQGRPAACATVQIATLRIHLEGIKSANREISIKSLSILGWVQLVLATGCPILVKAFDGLRIETALKAGSRYAFSLHEVGSSPPEMLAQQARPRAIMFPR